MRDSSRKSTVLAGIVLACVIGMTTHAQVVTQVTDSKQDVFSSVAIDDAGNVVIAVTTDDTGTNPAHAPRIVKWELPVPVRTEIGVFEKGQIQSLSISDDGSQVAFVSTANPTGQNNDASQEVFLMAIDGTGVVQLTDDPGPITGEVASAMLSGSGNRLVFASTADPLGINPSGLSQVFVIDADGTGLTQLTTAPDGFTGAVSISDDGGRIAFGHTGNVLGGSPNGTRQAYKVNADGTGLTQMTSFQTTPVDSVQIAGNGASLVYTSDGMVYYQEWTAANGTALVAGSTPSVTDNGKFIYYSVGGTAINYIRNSGGPSTVVTTTVPGANEWQPVVSGANQRVAFRFYGDPYPGGTNPDGWQELGVLDVDGTNGAQLTEHALVGFDFECDMTADGSKIVFTSSNDHTGANPDLSRELFLVGSDGGGLVQILSDTGAWDPQISDDGQRITFDSYEDLTGNNPQNALQAYAVMADGTGLRQLTPLTTFLSSLHTTLSADGSVVVFQSNGNFAGTNPGGSPELFAVPFLGGPITQVTDDDNSLFKNPQIDATGTWVAFQSQTDFDGANPNTRIQILRARVDGSLVQRITTEVDYDSFRPDISADGNRIAFLGAIDPLGTNTDRNLDLFVWDATTGFIQLTFTAGDSVSFVADNAEPRITDDGRFVYFLSRKDFFEPTRGDRVPYRVEVDTGTIERAAGLAHQSDRYFNNAIRNRPSLAVNADGTHVASIGRANAVDTNPDNDSTVFVANDELPARIRPGRDAPTVVTWDVERRPVRYDVIRGDVADLTSGGATVDLGAVVCIENDSPDATTAGHPDVDQPGSGQVFFYLYRGTQGLADGPGSYGQGTGGQERVPTSGDCAI